LSLRQSGLELGPQIAFQEVVANDEWIVVAEARFRMETMGNIASLQKSVVAVGHHTAFIAEHTLSGCEACTPLASVPFETIVLEMGGYNPSETTCILPQPNECPQCSASVMETTLVYRERARKAYAGSADLCYAQQ
jgi:hypothetical protein